MKEIAKYGMMEISLPRTSQTQEIIPEATFTLGNQRVRVRGFSENEDRGRVRFMPMAEGEWRYEMTWGEEKTQGAFLCAPAACHGPVRTAGCHFVYDDGTRL